MKVTKFFLIILLQLSFFACSKDDVALKAPIAPSLLLPTENVKDVETEFLFTWDSGSSAVNSNILYDLYLGKSEDVLEKIAEDLSVYSYNYKLDFSTSYYWQVVAKENSLETKSDIHSFTTKKDSELSAVSTLEADMISSSSFKMLAIMTDNGGAKISERGFLWDTKATDLTNKIVLDADQVDFNFSFSEVENNVGTYFFQAFSVNEKGISYGEIMSVKIPNSLRLVIKDKEGIFIADAIVKHFFNGVQQEILNTDSKGEVRLENIELGEYKFEVFKTVTFLGEEKVMFISSNSIDIINGENTLDLLSNISIITDINFTKLDYSAVLPDEQLVLGSSIRVNISTENIYKDIDVRHIIYLDRDKTSPFDNTNQMAAKTISKDNVAVFSSSVEVDEIGDYYYAVLTEVLLNNEWRLVSISEFNKAFSLIEEDKIPISIEMINVEGGSFQMGSNDGEPDEQPIHSVTLSEFKIGKYEVTQAQWESVMGYNPSYFRGENFPVDMVSWNDVQEFITKLNNQTGLNYRLPTESEWEYAARGGNKSQGYTYSGSNTLGDVAWHDSNSGWKTNEVGTKQANELGIYDMNGNVWESCNDWKGTYPSEAQTNPQGPTSGSVRILRGGGWILNAYGCRVANRFGGNPISGSADIGFRLARTID